MQHAAMVYLQVLIIIPLKFLVVINKLYFSLKVDWGSYWLNPVRL